MANEALGLESWLLYGEHGFAMVPLDVSTDRSHTRPYTKASHARPAVLMFGNKASANRFRESVMYNRMGDGYSMSIINRNKHLDVNSYINTFTQITALLYNRESVGNAPFPTCGDCMLRSEVISLDGIDRDLISTLFITSYALFLYVEHLQETYPATYTIKGFIMDPFSLESVDQEKDNDKYRTDTILAYLESKA